MTGDKPWPEALVGNEDHTRAACVIIGAGISGMCAAIDLIKRNKCHNFIIVEKSSGPGGTWSDNRYPGCCCDVWSALYSYSFEQKADWTRMYPGQEEILDYLVGVAQKYNLFKYIRFNTAVEEAHWDDTEKKWKIAVKVLGGKEAECHDRYTITSDFLVSAVGQLNTPKWPEIEGLDTFKGKKMHSSRWDWSYDLKGKRIAIIGNGCTAAQIAPEVAKVASHLEIYQRTPNWVIPRLDAPVSKLWRNIYTYVPPIRKRVRADMMDYREAFHIAVTDGESDFAKLLVKFSIDMLHAQLPDQPELWEKLTPKYPVGCKRVIISDDYFPCIARDNVHLEAEKIGRITPNGIEVDGKETEFDLIVCATGFQTTSFFQNTLNITGAGGATLDSIWSKGPRALYGMTAESMPNFCMMYGPNTNLGHNSIILMIEAQSRYINALIGAVLDARRKGESLVISPNLKRLDEFNTEMQRVLNKSSFAHASCNSWYKNADGMITQNWSGTVVEYQKMLSTVNWADYDLSGKAAEALKDQRPNIGRVMEETWVSYTTMGLTAASVLAVAAGLALKAPSRLRAR